MSDQDLIAAAIRAACPDASVDCLATVGACFRIHPVHALGWTGGVIDTVEADVEPLAALIVAALESAGRLAGPVSTSPETGPAGVIVHGSDLLTERGPAAVDQCCPAYPNCHEPVPGPLVEERTEGGA